MKYTSLYSLFCVFNIQELFYYEHVEAISREISYPLGSVLGKKPDNKYHVNPFQEHLTIPTRPPINFQTQSNKKTPKKKKKFRRKNRRRNSIQSSTSKTHKKTAIKRRAKKKRFRKKAVNTIVKNEDQSVTSQEVARKASGKGPRKPVDIIVHIKMDDVDYVI